MHRWRLALVVGLAALSTVTVAPAASVTEACPSATKLRLDGVPFRPELALTAARRARGLMYRRRAPRDGMLFVFPRATSGGFWMKNTLVPLTIAFFDSRGKRVRKLSMKPCRSDPCPIYDPGRKYRFALELSASDRRRAVRLGPVQELRRLSRLAE
ncbi:MAG: DUF192 domain-containing protein [Gaiellaceae bacterium]